MNAQTVRWLVILALIKKFSCDLPVPFQLQDSHLEAKEGSCVEIECILIRGVNDADAYWFWMKDRYWTENDYYGTIIYSTNSAQRPVSPDFADRVRYIGSSPLRWYYFRSSPNPLCSILICNLNKTDSGKYSFRFVGTSKTQTWATKTEAILTVKENPCPIVFETPPEVKENETITLSCSTLSSCPSIPQIEGLTQLQHSVVPLKDEQHKRTTTVSFTADWKDDGKEFSCQTQDNEDKYLVRNISVTVEYAPKDTFAMKSSESVIEGQSVTLTCSTKGRPNATYTWFKNNQSSQTGHEWMIKSINDSQSGEYHCEAQNKYGTTKSNPVIINVTYAPEVEIMMTPLKSEIRQGDEMTLTCNLKRSKPQPSSYTWFEDGTSIGQGQMYNVSRIEPENSGTYTCTATNIVATGTSQPFPIKVEYRPRKTSISTPSSQKRVKVGHPLIFTCNTEAYPAPETYSWYRISKNKQTDSLQWTSQKTSINSLHLKSVQRADEACYMCNATNSIDTGDDSESFCIDVLYPPANTTLSMDAEVREGQLITIRCTVESFPPSSFTLTRSSSGRSSDWHMIKADDQSHNNIFTHTFNVTSTHAGFYTCCAKNSEGEDRCVQRKLVVKYTPNRVTVKARPDLVVNENTLLTLDCSAQSYPPVTSFTWMKMTDGKDVIVNRTQSFTLKSVTPSDSGRYSCAASNEIGSGKSQPVEVKVKYAPKHTKITMGAEKQLSDGRRSVRLSCSSHCYPPVERYEWYMKLDDDQEKRVSSGQNYIVYSDKPGVYYCIAKNEINQRRSDPLELFLDRDFKKIFIPLFFILLIIIVIFFIYRCRRNKSIQQRTSNRLPWWSCCGCLGRWNGDRRRNLMNEPVLAEPSRSRDDLLPGQPRRPNAQPCQPRPDRTAASNINSVYCTVNLPGNQVPSAQKPNRQQGGHTDGDALNYASLHFGNTQKQPNKEQVVYAMVSKPKPPKKNEQETLEPYENMSTALAAKSPNPLNYDTDTDTSEDEVELNYSQVTFNQKMGRQRADTDSSTSDEEYRTQYSEVKI